MRVSVIRDLLALLAGASAPQLWLVVPIPHAVSYGPGFSTLAQVGLAIELHNFTVVLYALLIMAGGFISGFIAARRGFIIGLLTVVIPSVIWFVLHGLIYHPVFVEPQWITMAVVKAIGWGILACIGGVAGNAVAHSYSTSSQSGGPAKRFCMALMGRQDGASFETRNDLFRSASSIVAGVLVFWMCSVMFAGISRWLGQNIYSGFDMLVVNFASYGVNWIFISLSFVVCGLVAGSVSKSRGFRCGAFASVLVILFFIGYIAVRDTHVLSDPAWILSGVIVVAGWGVVAGAAGFVGRAWAPRVSNAFSAFFRAP